MDSRENALGRALGDVRRSTTVPQIIVVALALAMFAFRFSHQRLLVFINDEGYFLAAAHADVLSGTWASASPIAGTQGVHYGPMPIWFYRAVQTLFGPAPRTSILAMGIVVTGCQLAFAYRLTRGLRGGAYFFAAVAAFVASSPYQFVYSRMAWDPLVDAMSCAIVAALCVKHPFAGARPILLGLLCGIAIGSHPMVAVFLISVALVTLLELRRSPRQLVRTALMALAPAALLNMPFALYVANNIRSYTASATAPPPHVSIATYASRFLEPARVAGVSGIEYFFDDAWHDFVAWCGDWGPLLPSARFPLVLASAALAGLVLSVRSHSPVARRIATLALLTWFGHAAFVASRGVDPHPHYQFPDWWVIPAGIALLIVWARARAPRAATFFVVGTWAMACVQFAFIFAWMRYADERNGTNTIHYATPEAEAERALRDICRRGGANIEIDNVTHNFNVVLDYIATVDEACAHKTVHICGSGGGCGLADAEASLRVYRLRYARSVGGSLAVDAVAPAP